MTMLLAWFRLGRLSRTQMDRATKQNAALVEEMAAAPSSLKARALVQTMAVFNLGKRDAPQQAATRTHAQQSMRRLH